MNHGAHGLYAALAPFLARAYPGVALNILLTGDGWSAEGPVRLAAGPHALRLVQDGGPLYLLPENPPGPAAVLPEPLQKPLFDRAHAF